MKRDSLSERRNLLSEAKQALLKKRIAAARRPVPTVQTIQKRLNSADAPLSYAQERYWFLSQLEPDNPANNRPFACRFHGSLDIQVLEKALSDIFRRHEILRGTFQDREGKPVQIFLPPQSLTLRVLDISGLPTAGKMQEVTQRLISESKQPFDLTLGPLYRTILLRLDKEDHILLTVFHHMLFDAWSGHVFLHEIGALYEAFALGKPSPLPEPAVQYADYAHWQRRFFGGEIHDTQLAYWKRTLTGAPPTLSLPTDHPRPPSRSFQGAHRSLTIPLSLSESLKTLSRREGVTLFMTLLAAFNVLLHRYSAQDDIVIGTPVAGRPHPEIQGLIGFFVNTLPLRHDLSGDPAFRELLHRIKGVTVNALSHQDIPFEKLVEELNPPRDMSRTPLFQVMFNFQNVPHPVADLPGLTIEGFDFDGGTASFDLGMEIVEKPEGMVCTIEVNLKIFEAATAERMLGHYETLLKGICENPSRHVSNLPILTDAERHLLLVTWNERSINVDETVCIHQLFENQATRCPEAVALTFGNRHLTYRELNSRANRLARHLVELGVVPDSLVAIGAERSIEMVVGLLAILKAGGAYVPLDPAYPVDRLAYMLKDAAPIALLTQSWLKERWGDLPEGLPVIELDGDDQQWGRYSPKDLNPDDIGIRSNHLAYVIYTSGSTGAPKGVMIEHGNVLRLFSATEPWFHFDADDVWTLFHSFAFDFSVWEIWGALLHGGRLVIVPQIVSRSPEEFYELLCSEKVTILNQTPSAFRQLINARTGTLEHALRKIIFGGEALEVRHLKPWYERNGTRQTELVNMYGITETTVHVTYKPIVPADAEHSGASSIGVHIPDLRIYILDAHRRPVPVGVAGELYVGGAGVARGYLNRPELTTERFLPDPFARIVEPDARMYKTGDLGKWLPDGAIEYLGRNDFQVKIRGFRIELGEIEARLAAIPGVGEAVVLAHEDSSGDKRLVAYYTVKDAAEALTAELLRRHLASRLPEYMLPSAYMAVARFPLTPNGKTDRKVLPAPEAEAYAASAYQAPEGEREKALARVWSELLGVEKVGRHDHFFDLGGHSLMAVKMIEQLRREGLHTDVRVLFTTPTLSALAAAMGKAEAPVKVPSNRIPPGCDRITPALLPLIALEQDDIDRIAGSVTGGAVNIQDIYPLAPLQEGILFHHRMNSQSDAYCMLSILSFDSRELLDGFLTALQAVINRHDILRTAILWEGLPEPVQVVWRKAPLAVEKITIDLSVGDALGQLRYRFERNRNRIDVRKAPMMCAFIACDAANRRWLLALPHHHLVTDHRTMDVLVGEIQGHLAGEASRLPAALPFREFVMQARLGVSREEHEAFFRRMLEDVEEPTAPFGLMDVIGDDSDLAEAHLQLGTSLSRRLRVHARAQGVAAASIFHLAWALVLARLCGRDDVVFGTVLFGRMQGGWGADRVLGMFINTLPVRIGVTDDTVEQAVQKTHRAIAQLLHHEHAPLALAQRCSGVQASMPLFTSLINYRYNHSEARIEVANDVWKGIQLLHSEARTNYPLLMSVDDLGDGFVLTAQVQKPIEPMRVCRFLNTVLSHLIEALDHAPDTAVGSIEVVPEAERRQVLFDWNATKADYPKNQCIHQLFETQVRKTPDAVALQYKNERLSFADLNQRANRLAYYLRSIGIKADIPVGICMDRSLEVYTGVLGILKAGGAYVPLDPTYPMERLAYMLADSGADVLLTKNRSAHYFPDFGGRTVCLDNGVEWMGLGSDDNPTCEVGAENIAYVLYTSGSTGKPKGVAMGHGPLSNLIAWQTHTKDFAKGARTLQFAPLNFDVSFQEMFATWCTGGTLLVIADQIRRDAQTLLQYLEKEKVQRLFLPYIALQNLAETANFIQMFPSSLEEVVTAGEQLHITPAIAGFFSKLDHCTLHNQYGPTESHVVSSFTFQGPASGWSKSPPIGRPIHNTQLYVLDKHLRPVPIGITGELHIAGTPLARGYINKPEQTEEKFIQDSFSGIPGARMYKTGDLARYLPDGNLEFLGRMDNQVKIRGYRLELGEIEAALGQYPGIRQGVVLVWEYAPGDKRLVAYVVPHEKGKINHNDLRRFLRDQLPEYMIPFAFLEIDVLPVLPNGKMDRRALSHPGQTEITHDKAYVAPRTDMEKNLADVWASILNMSRIGIHDNFFELGGHSLMATRIVSQAHRHYGLNISLRAMFEHPTVSSLAEHVHHIRDLAKQIQSPDNSASAAREEVEF